MLGVEKQPHILLGKEDATPVAIVMGDPGRVGKLAALFESGEEIANNREYCTYRCRQGEIDFLMVSHGVGAAGATICFQELIAIGVKCIIRVGTCGTLQRHKLKQGDVCIIHASAKEDGVSSLLEPQGIPACGHFATVKLLADTAHQLTQEGLLKQAPAHFEGNIFTGTSVTSDVFYAPKISKPTLKIYRAAMIDVVEMEISALYTVARQNGVKAGALCAVDGCPFGWEKDKDYDPRSEKMVQAVAAMALIVKFALPGLQRLASGHTLLE